MPDATHLHYMRLALDASRQALPACRPNPPVGCAVVRAGELVTTGYTHPPGQHHAEADALSRVPDGTDGLHVYVTLEPCSFHGRTPSCARLLVRRHVEAVYIATLDPHPKNRGAGVEIVRQGGIPVEIGVLEDEVREFLDPYLIRS
ncbi:MAG: bifunctional diaminohydroxyphosphoribosylaminopyrimidine deaminase/5-amino-6-(5-phosphoribosylamino)uracil reductase RibD [Acidobacteriota bacterium]